jgi:hypothetical protein
LADILLSQITRSVMPINRVGGILFPIAEGGPGLSIYRNSAPPPGPLGKMMATKTGAPSGAMELRIGPTMSSEQPDSELSETAQQINDLFDSAELSKAIETEEFKKFLDYIPIAIVVSKFFRGDT